MARGPKILTQVKMFPYCWVEVAWPNGTVTTYRLDATWCEVFERRHRQPGWIANRAKEHGEVVEGIMQNPAFEIKVAGSPRTSREVRLALIESGVGDIDIFKRGAEYWFEHGPTGKMARVTPQLTPRGERGLRQIDGLDLEGWIEHARAFRETAMESTMQNPQADREVMTPEIVRAILEVFGPGSVLYETNDNEQQIIGFYNEQPYGGYLFGSIEEFVGTQLDVEDIYADRAADAAFYEEEGGHHPEGHHQAVTNEGYAFIEAIKKRAKQAGLIR